MALLDDFQIAVAPSASYARMVTARRDGRWTDALERPLLYALLVGSCVAIAATGQASPGLVATTTVAWSWVVVVQWVTAVLMTRVTAARRSVSESRAFELWFAGHVPWSLWLLLFAPAIRAYPTLPVEDLLLSMFAPIAWTAAIGAAFGRVVLRRSAIAAWLLAVLHQLAMVGLVLCYVAWAAGGWFRLVGP